VDFEPILCQPKAALAVVKRRQQRKEVYQAKCRMQGRAKDMTELGVYSGGAFAPASCEKEDIAVRPLLRREAKQLTECGTMLARRAGG